MKAPSQAHSLSRHLARRARALHFDRLPPEVVAKVKIAFLDLLSCAYESLDLSPSRNAIKLAAQGQGDSAVIGTDLRVPAGEAAFANAVLSHGLVREDMHTESVSHLGVVIFPTLLALTHSRRVRGSDFVLAAVCGYETGAAVGRALMDRETVRRFRPTGITGPLGAALAGSLQRGLGEDAMVSALGLAANATVGVNEWPATGADDMFFHAGFAARNAVTCVELADAGAYASEHALDGPAGLFAALGRQERTADVRAFLDGQPLEILAVYHKPAPACNYAQTACQVARTLVAEDGVRASEIEAIAVLVSAAALNYPGCNATGPFERVLQAKMSIRYCVAATLLRGAIEEANYRMLKDPEVLRLIGITSLEEAPEFTQAYPARQGTEVIVKLRGGRTVRRRMRDLIAASETEIRSRFRAACSNVLGSDRASQIEGVVDRIEQMEDVRALDALLGGAQHGG
ncbi:MAG TPA: MmgE/PrpD family protein [Steroidobacteraceae bacterium]|nr:MmgE/PrpD family protein [Steroidobacteraceae bacterium]